jgi:hypothetical protein
MANSNPTSSNLPQDQRVSIFLIVFILAAIRQSYFNMVVLSFTYSLKEFIFCLLPMIILEHNSNTKNSSYSFEPRKYL